MLRLALEETYDLGSREGANLPATCLLFRSNHCMAVLLPIEMFPPGGRWEDHKTQEVEETDKAQGLKETDKAQEDSESYKIQMDPLRSSKSSGNCQGDPTG